MDAGQEKVNAVLQKMSDEKVDLVSLKNEFAKAAAATLPLNEGTATQGGNFVPVEYAKRYFELVQAQSTAIDLCENVTMRNDIMKFPTISASTASTSAYWIAENATITSSRAAFGQISLDTKKVGSLVGLASEVWDDSDPSIARAVMEQMSKDVALKLDDEIYNGTNTQFTGFRTNRTGGAADLNIVAAAGADGDALSYDKIVDAIKAIETSNFKPTHIIMHPAAMAKLRKLKDSQNLPLFIEANYGSPFLKDGVIGTILGLKVITTTQLPADLTKGSGTSLTDILILTEKKTGLFGSRRELKVNSFYDIERDMQLLQLNMRAAFSLLYQKSGTIILDIVTL